MYELYASSLDPKTASSLKIFVKTSSFTKKYSSICFYY